jgi:ATP-dependent DNA ligase
MTGETPILFGRDSKGKLKQWLIYTEGADVIILHGQVGGKQAESRTTSVGKNIGRSNETSPEQQAELEAKAKWNKQLKKDYALSIEEIPESTLPHLATKLQDKAHTLNYDAGVDVLCKKDGVRMSAFLKDGVVFFQSRGGEEYPIIREIVDELWRVYFSKNANYVVDGEIYCHGMHLEDITSAVKKHNENTHKLEFHVFDLIDKTKPEQPWCERYEQYISLWLEARPYISRIAVIAAHPVRNSDDVYTLHDEFVDDGYEGIVLRPHNGVNSFGNRTADFIKYKKRKDAEFRVVKFTVDKKNRAIPHCEVDTEVGVKTFKAPMIGSDERIQALWQEYLDNNSTLPEHRQWLTCEFENYSKYGVPVKVKGASFRDCDKETGEPLE